MNKQEIFLLILGLVWSALMIWLFIEELYIEILKSVVILMGSTILGIIFAELGE